MFLRLQYCEGKLSIAFLPAYLNKKKTSYLRMKTGGNGDKQVLQFTVAIQCGELYNLIVVDIPDKSI